MRIVRDYQNWPQALKGSVVAVGNFDGVHRGHQAVLHRICEEAERLTAPSVVMCFEPHPRHYFQPDAPQLRIMTFADKAKLLREMGIEAVLAQRFRAHFAQIPAEDFIQKVLCEALGARKVITGQDFIFGHGRGGNTALLSHVAQEKGLFEYEAIAPLGNKGEGKFSSSKIREHLRQGEMHYVEAMLGRPYSWTRRVFKGDQRGRELGFPTANMLPPAVLLPRLGVYAVRGSWQGMQDAKGVANFGTRPTVGGTRTQLEVHWFDCDADLYHKEITVQFVAHLRDEMPFDGLEALKTQIAQDVSRAKEVLAC